MDSNYTHISVILDRSGSMSSVKQDTIGGFNTFLKGQQETPGKCTLSLAQFDDRYEAIHEFKEISKVPELDDKTFVPRGNTALYDAIGRTINDTGAKLSALPEDQRPSKVIFVIITDGQENSSHEFRADKIKEMVECQTNIYKWEFAFIGADMNTIMVAGNLGLNINNAFHYTNNADGIKAMYASLSVNASSYRTGKVNSMNWTDDDKKLQDLAGGTSSGHSVSVSN